MVFRCIKVDYSSSTFTVNAYKKAIIDIRQRANSHMECPGFYC